MKELGNSAIRIDALSKVTGGALYPGDYEFKNQLWMKVLFAKFPHAIIKNINTDKASSLPGVVLILTAKDVPNNEYGLIKADQPVLCGPGSNKVFGDRVRFIGDQVALVIAETAEIAEKALELIEVEYEELPIVTDPMLACQPGAYLIHPENENNLFGKFRIRKGDVDKAFSEAHAIVEQEYHTPVQEHAYLQPEAGVAYLDEEDRITVVVGGQWIHEDQEQIAHALKLPLERIRVIYPAIGGAFGGREDMSIQIILALAVFKLKQIGIHRPVKIVWSRQESIVGHHKRHAYDIQAKWATDRDGNITAAKVNIIADGGAYLYTSTKVLGNATLMCTGPYDIPNVEVDSCVVCTNNIPGGAFRGFGGPQAAFAAECQINKLAEKLDMDPVELRMRNLLTDGKTLSVGTPLPSGVSIDKVVEECAIRAGWKQKGFPLYRKPVINSNYANIKKGIGFACSYKNIGFSFGAPESCWAIVELHGRTEIERVVLRHGAAEVGQGVHTALIQMTSEALNVQIDKIQLVASDTSASKNSGSVSASRMTFMSGNAIRGAAKQALEKWKNEERPAISEFEYKPPRTTMYDPETGYCMPNFAYGYVAQVVECEVNIDNGEVRLSKVISVDDVGQAINPVMIEGQIEGAVVQAVGYALVENFIQTKGYVLTDKLSTYLIPTVLDIPDVVESVILENRDSEGPWGAKGMGEMPFLPIAPAIIDAVHDATGVWFNEFPLTAEKVYKFIKNRKYE